MTEQDTKVLGVFRKLVSLLMPLQEAEQRRVIRAVAIALGHEEP